MKNKPGFRLAMTWLHNWTGIVLGTLLFTIWWTGTLSVFDKEIDMWMQPETRIPVADQHLDVDQVISQIQDVRPDRQIESFRLYLPETRVPFFSVHADLAHDDEGHEHQTEQDHGHESIDARLNPQSGDTLGDQQSRAASRFFYPMHYTLLSGAAGYIIVALATLFMMVLLVTGVVIHRKIFADFFTFRPKKKLRRSSLDLHNIAGTIFLPFHFLICLSGLAIFAGFYAGLPLRFVQLVDPANQTVKLYHQASDYGVYRRDAAGTPGEMAPIEPMVQRAEQIWTVRYEQSAEADRIDAYHYGDANAVIQVRRNFPSNRTDSRRDTVFFDGVTGEVLADFQASSVQKARAWLEGFHQIRFDHWPIRWLYFAAGLSGCVLIGTGFVFWTASRTKKADTRQPVKIRLVEAMSVGSVTGIIVATGMYFIVNRLLATDIIKADSNWAEIEMRCFFYGWMLTFIHAFVRKQRAWADQCGLITVLAVTAVLFNWYTTGTNYLHDIQQGLWMVAGMDMALLVSAIVAALVCFQLRRPTRLAAYRKE